MGVTWSNPGGGEQTEEQWQDEGSTTIGLRLSREETDDGWDDVLILFNPHDGTVPFALPEPYSGGGYLELTTSDQSIEGKSFDATESFDLEGRSLVLLRAK